MQVISTITEMQAQARKWRANAKDRIVLVPTMGALHRGHGRLIEKAKSQGNRVVVSSFVNPIQFNDPNDLQNYPRTPDVDKQVCEKLEVDTFFEPSAEEMYPVGFLTSVTIAHLSNKIEGASRPGHFRGVSTVVAKLLNIVQPHVVVFGHKDAQQLTIVKHMVRDMAYDTEVVAVSTDRDKTGLALSSRNVLLSEEGRKKGLCLVRALRRVHFLVKKQNITHCGELLQAVRSAVNSAGAGIELDYAHIVSRLTLQDLSHVERGNTLVLVAATIDGVRLLDSTRL